MAHTIRLKSESSAIRKSSSAAGDRSTAVANHDSTVYGHSPDPGFYVWGSPPVSRCNAPTDAAPGCSHFQASPLNHRTQESQTVATSFVTLSGCGQSMVGKL